VLASAAAIVACATGEVAAPGSGATVPDGGATRGGSGVAAGGEPVRDGAADGSDRADAAAADADAAPAEGGAGWPVVPPVEPLPSCATPDVPFVMSCPREPLDCKLTSNGRRVHCACESGSWWCISGTRDSCFTGVTRGAACGEPGFCERGNGLVFQSCKCADAGAWECSSYGL